jgi:enoyl-CoA hydratase/carnithine racemase
MPTIALLNGHAFAGGFMVSMCHDYRIMNPTRGFLCMNELDFGALLNPALLSIFEAKIQSPQVFRSIALEAKRFPGPEALAEGIVDGLGGLDEVLKLVEGRKLLQRTSTGIYGAMKREMYRGVIATLEKHGEWQRAQDAVEKREEVLRLERRKKVEEWERKVKSGAKL